MNENQPINIAPAMSSAAGTGSSAVLKVIIAVVSTAAVIGGGGWYYMDRTTTKEKDDLQSQIADLQKQVKDLASEESSKSTSTTTTDETANWKTYTNTTYGFSFKYPSDWGKFEWQDDAGGAICNVSYAQSEHDGYLRPGEIIITISKDARPVDAIYQSLLTQGSSPNNFSKSQTTIGGKTATKVAVNEPKPYEGFPYTGAIYLIKLSDITLKIDSTTPTEGSADLLKISDSILSTFQFTK